MLRFMSQILEDTRDYFGEDATLDQDVIDAIAWCAERTAEEVTF